MELIVESNLTIGVACRIGNAELTWHMVQAGHGAYPDCRNWWPIHEAANGLHLECCKVLIESGMFSSCKFTFIGEAREFQ